MASNLDEALWKKLTAGLLPGSTDLHINCDCDKEMVLMLYTVCFNSEYLLWEVQRYRLAILETIQNKH